VLGVHRLLGPNTAKAVDTLLPDTFVEVLIWTATWRRNLRVNIISHVWADFWGGWLKFLVWR